MILKRFKRCYYLSVAGYCMAGLSLFGIPIVNYDGSIFERWLMYAVAAVFWISFIAGTILFVRTNRYCKTIEKKLKHNNFLTYKPKIGIINFFSNRESKIVDIVFIIFALTVIVLTIADVQMEWVMIPCLVIMFLSFILHSFFNGKNYLYIKAYKKFLDQKERKENE